MRLFPGRRQPVALARPSFGTWVLVQCAHGENFAEMPFARMEQLCSNAASIICGACYAEPSRLRDEITLAPALIMEAATMCRRTGEGFGKALADRQHTVLAWPWDHIATSLSWSATRAGEVDEDTLGRALFELCVAYSVLHREQLGQVMQVWDSVAAGVRADATPGLAEMGTTMLTGFNAVLAVRA